MNEEREREMIDGDGETTETQDDGGESNETEGSSGSTATTNPDDSATSDGSESSSAATDTTSGSTGSTDATTSTSEATTAKDIEDDDTTTEVATTSATTPEVTSTGTSPTTEQPLECPFESSIYRGPKNESATQKEKIYPNSYKADNGNVIKYFGLTCDKNQDKFKPVDDDSNITSIEVAFNTAYTATCKVKCTADGYQQGEAIFSVNIYDDKPSISRYASKVPVAVKINTPFNATVRISYPEGVDKKDYKMEFKLENGTDVYNLTDSDGNALTMLDISEELKYENHLINRKEQSEYNGTDIVRVKFSLNDSKIEPAEYKIRVMNFKECPAGEEEDKEGICCNLEYEGQLCTSIQVNYQFKNNGDGTDEEKKDGFGILKTAFNTSINNIFTGSPYWPTYRGRPEDENVNRLVYIFTFIKGSKYPTTRTEIGKSKRLLQQDGDASSPFNWDTILTAEVDPIIFGNALVSLIGPSDSNDNPSEIIIPDEMKNLPFYDKLESLVTNQKIQDAVKEITVVAKEQKITKDPENYSSVKNQFEDEIEYQEEPTKEEPKSWAEDNWWVILLICVGAVLLIGIVVAIIVVSTSSSGGSSKTNKKDLEKSEKLMETVIPIDKIKQENEISDEDIYKPFTYEVIMEGYLLKEGHDRVVGKWQRRYCVLYFEPAALRIYESMIPSYYGKVYIDEKQSIPLECYNGIEYKEGSNEFTLILKVRDSSIKAFEPGEKERKISMKVEGGNGVETAKKWVECFRDFKNQKPKAGDAWTRPLIIDQNNGKISTTTNKAAEKKNEEIVLKAQQRRQAIASTK